MPVGQLCLLWINVYLNHLPIFDWVFLFSLLICMSCLYILGINLLSVASFANIFSHSIGYLFILLMASFAVQKLLSLIRSHLFRFVFIPFALGYWSRKMLLFMSENVLSMFSSRNFMVSCLIFRSLNHFVCFWIWCECYDFIDSHVAVQLFQHYLLKRLCFLRCIF